MIAFIVGVAIAIPVAALAELAGVGSWGLTAIGGVLMLLVSLLDRDGFYGADRPSRH